MRGIFWIILLPFLLFGQTKETNTPLFGYIPYSYKVSAKDTISTTKELKEIFDSPIGLNSISFDSIFDEEANQTAPLVDDILEFAMAVYGTDDKNSSKIFKDKILYTVKKGDSFIKLAKDFNTTVFDIKRWNKIKNRDIVRVDEKLVIYPNKKTPLEKIKLIKKLESYGKYTVKPGDTLSSIVRKFAVGKKETIKLNKLKSSNSIRVGQKLIIPLPQKKIDAILKKIEAKKRAKKLALERKRKLEMAKKGKYELCKADIFKFKRKIRVIATAYTSHRSQTDSTPFIAAWNNRIRPGMKVIAVSNDLIKKYGITNGTKVRISGLPGVYVVRDKMHPRLKNHIDIYMGTNISKALRWGRRRVILYW